MMIFNGSAIDKGVVFDSQEFKNFVSQAINGAKFIVDYIEFTCTEITESKTLDATINGTYSKSYPLVYQGNNLCRLIIDNEDFTSYASNGELSIVFSGLEYGNSIKETPVISCNLRQPTPIVSNLTYNRNYNANTLTVDFSADYMESYSVAVNGTNYGQVKTMSASAVIVGKNTITVSVVYKGNTVQGIKEFWFLYPGLKDISVNNDSGNIDSDTIITLDTPQNYTNVDLYRNDMLIGSYGIVTTITVDKTKIVNGRNTFYVVLKNAHWDGTPSPFYTTTQSKSVYANISVPQASVSDFTIDQLNIDNNIVCTANQLNVYNWTIQAIQSNGVVKASKSGTGDISCTFAPGEINTKGETIFKIIYSNTWNSGSTEQIVTLTRTEPFIVSLEPDNVAQNINKQINVTWTAHNPQSYKLVLDGITYTGTVANGIVLPSNTLSSGTKTMTLTIIYISSWGDVRTATKTVTFLAYGNPPNPVLDGTTIYNTALPTFTWTSSDQVGYELKLRNSSNQDIISTGEVISLNKQYTTTLALDNNSTYTLILRVKNQYNLWSDWVTKVLTTSFVVPNTPTIALVTTDNASIIVSFNIEYTSIFSKAEIWRKTNNTDWIRIAYNLDNTFAYEDKFVGNETYYYKVRSIGSSGGIAESETLSATLGELTPIKNFHLTNVEDFTETIELIGNPTVRITNNREVVSTLFAGCKAPKIDKGEASYKSLALSFSVKEETYSRLLDIVDNARVLLYRDGRGRKLYCQLANYPSIAYSTAKYLELSFNIVEVEFIEGDFYSGSGNQPSLFFDGTWYFDGTVELDGEV